MESVSIGMVPKQSRATTERKQHFVLISVWIVKFNKCEFEDIRKSSTEYYTEVIASSFSLHLPGGIIIPSRKKVYLHWGYLKIGFISLASSKDEGALAEAV